MAQRDTTDIRELLQQIRTQLAELTARVSKLEGVEAQPEPAAAGPEETAGAISEEVLLAISAGVAAFLGERVRIRQIRVIGSPAWAQQGRVSIQASHRLH